jgi:nucleoside-diphosphate-sugar epimerase
MNLVIGKTSQLAQYFPSNYVKISSRDIPRSIFDQEWDRVFICFAEQKTYNIKDSSFDDVNYTYTRSIIEKLKANKIIFYSTAELWNNTCGPVNLNTPYNYHKTDYVASKEKITEFIKHNYKNVIVAYPFNFNSIYRLPPFLFGKIFDSIVNKKRIEIGDTYYYRELLHPSFIVNETLYISEHKLIGCGKLTFINDFIRKLYSAFDLRYEDYIIENIKEPSVYRKNVFYNETRCDYGECNLLDVLIKELYDKSANKIS